MDSLGPPPYSASVGVVVPSYQAERFLESTLRSLAAQTVDDWRCVIVNDGATDGTAAIAARWSATNPRIGVWSQRNSGLVASRHAGLAQLAGHVDYVMFLDSDDVLLPTALEALIDALKVRPDAVAASGTAELIDAVGAPLCPGEHSELQRSRVEPLGWKGRRLAPEEDTTFRSLTIENRHWPPATVLFRTQAVLATGGFDETMAPAEDWEMLLRLTRLGPIVWVDKQVAWYRRHDANATLSTARALHAQAALRRKVWSLPYLTPEQRETVMVGWRTKLLWESKECAGLALENLRSGRIRPCLAAMVSGALAAAQLAFRRPVAPPKVVFKAVARLHEVARGADGSPVGSLAA